MAFFIVSEGQLDVSPDEKRIADADLAVLSRQEKKMGEALEFHRSGWLPLPGSDISADLVGAALPRENLKNPVDAPGCGRAGGFR